MKIKSKQFGLRTTNYKDNAITKFREISGLLSNGRFLLLMYNCCYLDLNKGNAKITRTTCKRFHGSFIKEQNKGIREISK